MASEGFFFTDTIDAIVDVLPLGTLNEEQERKLREAVGLLAARDFTLETFLGNVISGQHRSEVVTAATGGVAVTFPSAFRTPPTVVACIGDTASGAILSIENGAVTTTGFEVRFYDAAGVEQNGVPFRINWIAAS